MGDSSMSNQRRLNGRIAVVTGAAQGLGRSIAERFAREGATVAVLDINGAGATATAAAIGCGAIGVACDVTDSASLRAAEALLVSKLGSPQIVVNNAGIGQSALPLVDLSEEEWNRVIAVNLTGVFLGCKIFGPHAVRAGRAGRIINISSINGLSGPPFNCAYNASKWGVIGLTKTMALEVAGSGTTVNAIAPGPANTPFQIENVRQKAATLGITEDAFRERVRSSIPLGRWTEPDDIAAAAAFLASDDAAHITGEVLPVTGGMSTWR
jgi:NAD(P)-dependent dehydrogenase (short-subunit alcohol dehydrogenase family)